MFLLLNASLFINKSYLQIKRKSYGYYFDHLVSFGSFAGPVTISARVDVRSIHVIQWVVEYWTGHSGSHIITKILLMRVINDALCHARLLEITIKSNICLKYGKFYDILIYFCPSLKHKK